MTDGSWHGRSRWSVLAIVGLLHLAALWWLQAGLSRDAVRLMPPELLVAVELVSPTPPVRLPEPVSRAAPRPALPTPAVVPTPVATVAPARPAPAAVTPAPEVPAAPAAAVLAVSAGSGPGTSAGDMATAARGAPPASPGPATTLVLPTAQAAYLHNPSPAYPAISRRLNEQGRVLVRVLIGADGLPQKAEIQTGSGYDRLDRVALQTVMAWRFVPGRRGDVPEAMWVSVPIQFQLE